MPKVIYPDTAEGRRAVALDTLVAQMERPECPPGGLVVAIDPVPTVTIDIRKDGFDDLMGGPSQAKPPKTYRVPGGGAKEIARRLAKMQTKQGNQ